MTRSEAREQAFFVLFEKSFCEDLAINEIIETAQEAGLIKINNFAGLLLDAAEKNAVAIDDIIVENLRGWTIQRLPKVSLAVLRLAVCEIKYVDDVPAGVTVNEAVELAKKFDSDDSYTFINGILGAAEKMLAEEKN